MTCVPEVSLLDPNEIIRGSRDEKISYKHWKKHQMPQKTTQNPPSTALSAQETHVQSCSCDHRVEQLSSTIDRQQVEIDCLRNENETLRRDFSELKIMFVDLSQKMKELSRPTGSIPTGVPNQHIDPFAGRSQPTHSGRWSLPGDYSKCVDSASTDPESDVDAGVLLPQSGNRCQAPPDKSQMMHHLFKKYFPGTENVSPSNVPIFDYTDGEKSIATVNYLTKYKLLSSNERVLDISKLKRQSKLF